MAKAPTIYLVDDDDAVRKALGVLLDVEGFAVRGFGSGQAFLDDLADRLAKGLDGGGACCLITDVHMAGMNGLELVRALRGRGVALPVLVITGRASATLGVQAMDAGANRVIEKPFSPDEIIEAIEATLATPPAA